MVKASIFNTEKITEKFSSIYHC